MHSVIECGLEDYKRAMLEWQMLLVKRPDAGEHEHGVHNHIILGAAACRD